jgi:hypothetical protein
VTHETWTLLATVAFTAAGAAVAAACILFFALDIGDALSVLSGRRSARGIADLRAAGVEGKAVVTGPKGRARSRSRSSGPIGSGRVHPAHSASRRRGVAAGAVTGRVADSPAQSALGFGTTVMGSAAGQALGAAGGPHWSEAAARGAAPGVAAAGSGTTVIDGVGSAGAAVPTAAQPAVGTTVMGSAAGPASRAVGGAHRLDTPARAVAPGVAAAGSGTTVIDGVGSAGAGVPTAAQPATGTTVIGSARTGATLDALDAWGPWPGESANLGAQDGRDDLDQTSSPQVVARFRYTSAKESL